MSFPRIEKPILINQRPQGQQLYQGPDGQTGNKDKIDSIFLTKVAEKTNKRNLDVQAHEDLHESVAGKYATGKVVNYGSDQVGNPIATDGHVTINMPKKVEFKNPLDQIDETREHAKAVAASAIAPQALGGDAGRLSSADRSVYAQANALLGTAETARSQRLVFEGQIAQKQGKTPDKNQELNSEMITSAKNPEKKDDKNRKPLDITG